MIKRIIKQNRNKRRLVYFNNNKTILKETEKQDKETKQQKEINQTLSKESL